MMFYIGLLLAFCAGVLGVGVARKWVHNALPQVDEQLLDAVRLILLVVGLIVAAYNRHTSVMTDEEREDLRRYAMLDITGRVQMNEQGGLSATGGEVESLLNQAVTRDTSGGITGRCDDIGRAATAKLIELHPRLPQAWFARAMCRRQQLLDAGWKDDAQHCVDLTRKMLTLRPHADWYTQLKDFCEGMLR
jgi:hypothetical protein